MALYGYKQSVLPQTRQPVPGARPLQPKVKTATPTLAGAAGKFWKGITPGAISAATSNIPQAGQPGPEAYDFSSDPVLQRIQALTAQSVANSEAAAQAARVRLAIQLGDPTFAKQAGLDENTQSAAGQNPYSTLKDLAHSNDLRTQSADERLNNQNLSYSSTFGNTRGELGRQYGESQTRAYDATRAGFASIASQLLAAEQAAAFQNAQALSDAAGRAESNPANYPGPTPAYTLPNLPLPPTVAKPKIPAMSNFSRGR